MPTAARESFGVNCIHPGAPAPQSTRVGPFFSLNDEQTEDRSALMPGSLRVPRCPVCAGPTNPLSSLCRFSHFQQLWLQTVTKWKITWLWLFSQCMPIQCSSHRLGFNQYKRNLERNLRQWPLPPQRMVSLTAPQAALGKTILSTRRAGHL